MIYPNGLTTTYGYDNLNRLTSVETRNLLNEVMASYAYTLNAKGQRTHVEEGFGGVILRTIDYVYDVADRLVEEHIADTVLGNRTITYTYDNVGNRLEKNDNGVITTYAYDENDRLTSSAEAGVTTTYTYDDNGNMLSQTGNGESYNFSYNALNQLTHADITTPSGATSVEYVYDHDGIRVGKTMNGTDITRYIVDKNRPYAQVLEEQRTNGVLNTVTSYVYGDTLLSQSTGGMAHYYLYDGMHSVRGLADSAGTLTDAYTYDAYGNLLDNSGPTINPYLYRGEQFDADLDAYYLRARYYQPGIGRFLTTDPIEGSFTVPLTRHRYLYGNGDPINHIDPTGRMSLLQKCITVGIVTNLASMALGQLDALEGVYQYLGENVLPDAGVIGASVFAYVDLVDLGGILNGMLAGQTLGWEWFADMISLTGCDPLEIALPTSMHHFRVGGIVGIDFLFSFGSGEFAPLVYWGGQAEYSYAQENGKYSPAGVELSVYNGWVWNLWNATDYSGPFKSFSFGGMKSGFSVAYDAIDGASKGPYALTIPVGSMSLGEKYERTNYRSIGGAYGFSRFLAAEPVHYSYGALAAFYAVTQLAVMAYSAQNLSNDGGASLMTATIGFSMTYTIMKSKEVWNRNQPNDAEGRSMLEQRRTQGRPGVDRNPGEWRSGPGRWVL